MASPQELETNHPISINAYKERFAKPELVFSHSWKTIDEIKNECIVSLDTNILLSPYKLKKESIKEIEKVYKRLQAENRLLLSKQAVREFAANKPIKLSELFQNLYERKIKLKEPPEYPILFDQQEYINLCSITKEIKEKIDLYNSSIDKLGDKIKEWVWNDPVVSMYSEVFREKIIVDHKHSDADLQKDLERRRKFKIPPGYKDSSKEDNSEGDLAIWHTLLEIGRTHKQHLVFVSEDRKSDWWTKSNGGPLIPKFELIHEYQNNSDGKNLHLLILSEFLGVFGVPQTVINEVKNEESRLKSENSNIKTFKLQFRPTRSSLLVKMANKGIDIYTCQRCGFKSSSNRSLLEIHHIISLKDGGTDDLSNILLLCPNCHKFTHES